MERKKYLTPEEEKFIQNQMRLEIEQIKVSSNYKKKDIDVSIMTEGDEA